MGIPRHNPALFAAAALMACILVCFSGIGVSPDAGSACAKTKKVGLKASRSSGGNSALSGNARKGAGRNVKNGSGGKDASTFEPPYGTEEITASESPEIFRAMLRGLDITHYEKRLSSGKESFRIVNRSEYALLGMKLEITYTDASGEMLHKRTESVTAEVPPGEGRIVEIPTFDKRHSYYYKEGAPPRSGGTPYDVSFKPLALYVLNWD